MKQKKVVNFTQKVSKFSNSAVLYYLDLSFISSNKVQFTVVVNKLFNGITMACNYHFESRSTM